MNKRINKTSICCIVFLDIIDYSKTTDFKQLDVKNQFNELINQSLKDVAQEDRIILDTGDGAAIAYMGSPEDALFMAMRIRDAIIKNNTHSSTPLYVRFGINLGPVHVVSDINGHPNLIGDGINVAQRIMNFAKPNQILVSRSYYEVTSRLTQEISQMFDYSGIKQDKHVREHEIYSVRLLKDIDSNEDQPAALVDNVHSIETVVASPVNWKYVTVSLLILAGLYALIQLISSPSEPVITIMSPPVATTAPAPVVEKLPETSPLGTTTSNDNGLMPNEVIENSPIKSADTKTDAVLAVKPKNATPVSAKATDQKAVLAQEKSNKIQPVEAPAQQESLSKAPQAPEVPQANAVQNANDAPKSVAPPTQVTETVTKKPASKKEVAKEKSGWEIFTESVKQGQAERKCSQAEIAMGQCR